MSKMSKTKGANGEREILRWFVKHFDQIERLSRNLAQSREGGCDCTELPGIALEVKRQESLSLPAWWRQTTKSAIEIQLMPVLVYRQNRGKWKFCIPASLVTPRSWGFIQLDEAEFILWYTEKLMTEFN